jgi:hypothetical protein
MIEKIGGKMDYKDGKWGKKILELQHTDGSWGYFHSLSKPTPQQPMTTEQALRRLEILGYTIDDKPIQKAVNYLHNCLTGKEQIPDHYEVGSDWKSYLDLMVSTWIKRFTPDNKSANDIASKWVEIVNNSFIKNEFDQKSFNSMYDKILCPEKGKHIWGFMNFYGVSILANNLDKKIEPTFFEYVMNYPTGIYYMGYNKPIIVLPEIFQSKVTNNYLRTVELLTAYKTKKCKDKLVFIKKWLESNKIYDNEWDLGNDSKDNILLPLSDSWRKDEDRIKDCTYCVKKIIKNI